MGGTLLDRELSKAGMDGLIVDRGHAEYDKYRRIWNGLADRRPAAIVRARTVDDVRKTVRVAADQGALLAVRCGGHSLPGFSTCDSGIVLDLSLINNVVVDAAAGVAEVGGGALLSDLDKAGARAGLVTPAGVVSHTGVAGLTLGGGMGWLSRKHGLTIDNLLGAEVVTADGRLLWASAESEPELFWGLRGGGGNFGVVTKFKFRMYPLGPLVVGTWTYSAEDCDSVFQGFERLCANAPRELTSTFNFTSSEVLVTACWSGALKDGESAVAPFGKFAAPLSGSFGAMAHLDLQMRYDEEMAWGKRYYSKGGFLGKIDAAAIACIKREITTVPMPGSDIYMLRLGGAVTDIDENATAYSGRAASYYWMTNSVWSDPSDDARYMGWGRKAAESLAAISMQGNYVNEQGDSGKDVALNAYGAEKYARLARLKGRYDPANLFRLNQNIEPKA